MAIEGTISGHTQSFSQLYGAVVAGRVQDDHGHRVDRSFGGDAPNDGFKLRDVDGLDDMIDEAGLAASAHVFDHPVAAEGDAGDSVAIANLFHELIACGIRQTDIADDDVEGLNGGQLQCRCGISGGLDLKAGTVKELGQSPRRVGVIFNQ